MDSRTAHAPLILIAALSVASLSVTASTVEEMEVEGTLIVDGNVVEVDRVHDRHASTAEDVEDWDDDDDEAWREILEAVAVLEDGTPEERLELLTEALQYGDPLESLDRSPPDDPSGADRVVDRLAAVMAGETDPWLAYLLAKSLVDVDHPGITELFVTFSRHAVPAVRGMAVRHFGYVQGDDDRLDARLEAVLLEMWESETVPWIRADLVRRLTDHENTSIVDECEALLDDVDPDLVAAAVYCVDSLEGPDSERLLARRAASGDDIAREHALRALAGRDGLTDPSAIGILESIWRAGRDDWARRHLMRILDRAGSTQVVDDARSLVRDGDPRVASVAISLLERRRDPEDLAVLIDRARNGDEVLRATALRALDSVPIDPGVEAVVLEALDPAQPQTVRITAVEILSGRIRSGRSSFDVAKALDGRRRYIPVLREIAADDPSEWVRRTAAHGVESFDGGIVWRFYGCSGVRADRQGHRLVATTGGDSLRCHDRPGHETTPGEAFRITTTPGGTWVGERFDDGAEVWFSVVTQAHGTCWLPADRIRPVGPGETSPALSKISTAEIDIAIERTRTQEFLMLEELGLVRRFDEGKTLTGVRLTVDPAFDALGTAILRSLRD